MITICLVINKIHYLHRKWGLNYPLQEALGSTFFAPEGLELGGLSLSTALTNARTAKATRPNSGTRLF
jgi:hypothetical protein